MIQQPAGAHTVPTDVREQMAAMIRDHAGTQGSATAPQSAPPAVPTGPAAPPAAGPAPFADAAQQALADVIPMFKLPGSPEGNLAPPGAQDPDSGAPGAVESGAPSSPATGAPSGDDGARTSLLPPERAQQITEWLSTLSPRELLVLDGAMAGDIDPQLASSLLTGQPYQTPAPQAPATATPAPAAEPPFDPNAYADPDLAAYIKSRLDDIDTRVTSTAELSRRAIENDQQQIVAQHRDALTTAAARFGEKYGLDAAAVERVAGIADQLGIIGGLFNSSPAAPLDSVYERALELGLRSDDTFYQQQIERVAGEKAIELARQQAEQADTSRTREMKKNAGTVTAIASRDLPKTPEPIDPRMLTEEQRLQAMAALIRKARGN